MDERKASVVVSAASILFSRVHRLGKFTGLHSRRRAPECYAESRKEQCAAAEVACNEQGHARNVRPERPFHARQSEHGGEYAARAQQAPVRFSVQTRQPNKDRAAAKSNGRPYEISNQSITSLGRTVLNLAG